MLVDYEYYTETFNGQPIDANTFKNLNIKSQSIIEYIIGKQEGSILELSNVIQDKIKQAICNEIEYISNNGGEDVLIGNDNNQFTSEHYSSYSYTKAGTQANSIKYVNGIPIAPMIHILLQPTGLLYKGVKYVV